MPLYEVVLEERYYNQSCINRWNYLGSGTPAAVTGSFALLTAMGLIGLSTALPTDTVGRAIQNMQNTAVTFIQATARAIYVDTDFYANPFLVGTTGAQNAAGDTLSPTNAFGFRSSRVRQSIGRGYKRFVGMAEFDLNNGGIMSSGALTNMEAVRAAMGETLTYDDEGNTLTFTPCIAQKEEYTTPSGKKAYRYYPTEVAQSTHLAQGITWEIYTNQRTQNSRQYGRGS